jgi:hypothetical protein
VTHALLGELAGCASHAVVMAIHAGRRVENRTKSGACIMSPFKLCLIEGNVSPGGSSIPLLMLCEPELTVSSPVCRPSDRAQEW